MTNPNIDAPIEELENEFDMAFDEATIENDNKVELEASKEDAPQEGEAEPSEEEATQEASEDSEAAEDTDEATNEVAEEPEQESAPEQDELANLKALYQLERDRRESAERRYQTSEGRLRAVNKQLEGKAKTEPSPELSAALKEFKEEFPEFIDPINELVNARVQAALADVEKLVDTRVAPIQTTVEESTKNAHLAQIEKAHPDWQQILNSGDFDKWMVSLNPVAKAGVEHVMQQGTTGEVIEMFNIYKSEVGNSTPRAVGKRAAPKKDAPSSDDINAIVNERVQAAMAAMAVPSSRSAAPNSKPKEVDPDDFDAAFDEATKS